MSETFENSHPFAVAQPRLAVLGLAFRPLFLLGALFSACAAVIWALVISGIMFVPFYGGGLFWHVHEMIFGFVTAIVVGFLLTAVQNWTGVKSVNGWPLSLLVGIWLLARIGFLWGELFSPIILAAIDISFLLLAVIFLAYPIIKVRQLRNLFFIPLLLILAILNGVMHLSQINGNHSLMLQVTYSALILIALLMTVIGGRIIPMFTANGTKTQKVQGLPLLDNLALTSSWILLLFYLAGVNQWVSDHITSAIFAISAVLHFIRWARWRFWITIKHPLLWTLHLSYVFIPVAWSMMALSLMNSWLSTSIAWHLLTVGAIGTMILSMICRVSLGHTGRTIESPRWMLPAFILVLVAALSRTILLSLLPGHYLVLIQLSAVSWFFAYLIFVIGYFSILTRPRIDLKPG